jgi:tRNA (cmo5U34)-methyltransferase
MTKDKKDQIFASPLEEMVDFRFDEKVADVFPDMIQRSVPGYGSIIQLIGIVAQEFVKPDSLCYDLGCSLGAASLAMRRNILVDGCRIVSVDNSEAMLDRFRDNLAKDEQQTPVELVCKDIRDVAIDNASMVVLNFTLQFVPVEDRLKLLSKIYQGMLPGGILVLSEKISFEDQNKQDLLTKLHHAFKRSQGYSDLEISQKRSALENVLIPETVPSHLNRLLEAGFEQRHVWFQSFNFISLIAIK